MTHGVFGGLTQTDGTALDPLTHREHMAGRVADEVGI